MRLCTCIHPRLKLAAGITLVVLVLAGIEDRATICRQPSLAEITRLAVLRLAATPTIAACPTIEQLAAAAQLEPVDPYGERYQVLCGADGFIVGSLGEDARPGTADDIWSPSAASPERGDPPPAM
jgi:hypothetical protein